MERFTHRSSRGRQVKSFRRGRSPRGEHCRSGVPLGQSSTRFCGQEPGFEHVGRPRPASGTVVAAQSGRAAVLLTMSNDLQFFPASRADETSSTMFSLALSSSTRSCEAGRTTATALNAGRMVNSPVPYLGVPFALSTKRREVNVVSHTDNPQDHCLVPEPATPKNGNRSFN